MQKSKREVCETGGKALEEQINAKPDERKFTNNRVGNVQKLILR